MIFLVSLLSNLLINRHIICIGGIFELWLDDIESPLSVFLMELLWLQISDDVGNISDESVESSICVPFRELAIFG